MAIVCEYGTTTNDALLAQTRLMHRHKDNITSLDDIHPPPHLYQEARQPSSAIMAISTLTAAPSSMHAMGYVSGLLARFWS